LNRATDPRLRDQIGEGRQDDDELNRAADAARRGAEKVLIYLFSLGELSRRPLGEVSAATEQDVLSEDHPHIDAAVRGCGLRASGRTMITGSPMWSCLSCRTRPRRHVPAHASGRTGFKYERFWQFA